MTRRASVKPRLWRCVLCGAHGRDTDPADALTDHYMQAHYQPPPF
jgi:hypothetical protein